MAFAEPVKKVASIAASVRRRNLHEHTSEAISDQLNQIRKWPATVGHTVDAIDSFAAVKPGRHKLGEVARRPRIIAARRLIFRSWRGSRRAISPLQRAIQVIQDSFAAQTRRGWAARSPSTGSG